MTDTLIPLYPPAADHPELEGLYLAHRLHDKGRADHPYVYANFIASLDGRIAVDSGARTGHSVPAEVTNTRDWRLYQELAGQADLLISSGRFFRQAAAGEAQDVLPLGSQPAFADIRAWRAAEGLSPQPDIAILSGSLDIPPAALADYAGRRVLVITGEGAATGQARQLEKHGIEVVRAGSGARAHGGEMIEALARRGYRSIYAVAGPAVFHTLVEADVLDRLYLTITHQLLSGDSFDTLIWGRSLTPARGMRLVSLYQDRHAPAGAGQWFSIFEPAAAAPG